MADKRVFSLDPYKTTVAELLEIADKSSTGIITIKGEFDDGTVEWGVAVVMNENASDIIDAINDGIASAEESEDSDPAPAAKTLSN